MSSKAANALGINYKFDSIYTNTNPEKSSAIDIVQTKSDLVSSLNTVLEGVKTIVLVMIVAAVILTVVVLYNLGILSFIERFKELSTLKVLGFRDKAINYLLVEENVILTLIGLLIGIPCGVLFTKAMVSLLPESMDIAISVRPYQIFISLGVVVVTSLIVSLVITRKTRTLDMVSSLKLVE